MRRERSFHPSYVDIVSKINEIIEILSIEKVDDKDLR